MRRLLCGHGDGRTGAHRHHRVPLALVSARAAAHVDEGLSEVGREKRVENRIQARVEVGEAMRDNLEDDEAVIRADVVQVEFPQEHDHLKWRPTNGECDDNDDDRASYFPFRVFVAHLKWLLNEEKLLQ